MLELPPAAAEEYARKQAEKAADLPFVFEIYAQSVAANIVGFANESLEDKTEALKEVLEISKLAVSVLKEEYK